MSIKAEAIWAPAPSTTRGQPTQLSCDPKGERLAYASNKSIFLRSIDHPSQSTQYTSHTTTTTVARFSPSGYYVASGDVSGKVRVWDCVSEGSTKGEYSIISGRINDLAWDGDSQRIIAVGDGKEKFGHCITADSGNTVGEISGHSFQINTVSVRQQRPLRAATGSDDTSLAFFHGAPFKFNTSLRKHQRYIYGVAFSPDGAYLVSVGADKKIWLYDGKTGEEKGEIGKGEHTGSIFAVSWAKDSKRFVTASADQTVKIWDAESGKVVHSWRMGEEGKVSVQDHQVGVVWPAGRSDGLIISLNLAGDLIYLHEGKPDIVKVVQGHQKNITSIVPGSKDEGLLKNITSFVSGAHKGSDSTFFTGDTSGRICAYDHTGHGETVEGDAHKNYVSGLASSPGRIYSVGWDDTLRTIDTSAKTFTGTSTKTDGQPRGVATNSTSTIVATHKGISILSEKDNSVIKSIATSYSPVVVVAAKSGDIAVGGDDSAQHMYDADLKEMKTIPHPSQITALSFSPSSNHYLAVGFASGKILVYEPNNPEPVITRWSSHTGRVTSIDWDESGQKAVSGSLDTNIFVWSVKKPGQRVNVGRAHKEGVNGVRWAGESSIVSVGGDAAFKRWKVEGVDAQSPAKQQPPPAWKHDTQQSSSPLSPCPSAPTALSPPTPASSSPPPLLPPDHPPPKPSRPARRNEESFKLASSLSSETDRRTALHRVAQYDSKKRAIAELEASGRARELEKQILRRWKPGDVYAPHDLSPVEMAKWKVRRPGGRDVFDMLGIDPMGEWKNFSIMSEYMTKMGRIRHRKDTGLRAVNQRKIAKAIRRAVGMGLMPSVHKHPEVLETEARMRNMRKWSQQGGMFRSESRASAGGG